MRGLTRIAGFSLAELGLAILIVGVLIAGVLKSSEMIQTARIVSTISQIKEIETSSMIFMNKYGAMPGDIESPADKIPNCVTAQCAQSGNEDNYIGLSKESMMATAWDTHGESRNFWLHLAVTGILVGVNGYYTDAPTRYGIDFPQSPFGGGWQVQSFNDEGRRRTYMMLQSGFLPPEHPDAPQLTPSVAYQIDTKFDDGLANNGVVRAYSKAGEGRCIAGGETPELRNTYRFNETGDKGCVLWIMMTGRF